MRTLTLFIILTAHSVAGCSPDDLTTPEPPAARSGAVVGFPDVIPLPQGFWPEGIAFGRGATFYVSSLATGALFRGDARTGAGELLVAGQPGRELVGLKYQARTDRLIVAGGLTGKAYIFDATSGATLAEYQLADPGEGLTLVNDVVLARNAAYLTDSYRAALYRIPLPVDGSLAGPADVQVIPISGDFVLDPASPIGNANGIVAMPDGRHLVVVNSADGRLYRVDPLTGHATAVDLDRTIAAGDGLLLIGLRLYVVEGPFNQITVIRLESEGSLGVVERVISDPELRFPSTIAQFGGGLYAVNARFDVAPDPEVEYEIVRLELHP